MKEKLKKWFDNNTTRGKILRLVLVLIIVAIVLVVGYFILRATGLWEKVNSIEKIRNIVEKGGAFSFVIFLIFQILQTTILQIPAIFVTIAGALIFGNWTAFFLSYLGVMIGSIIMFWIGRKAGRKFLNWLIGSDSAEKWINRISSGKYLFFLMMVFPMFPDDILCVVAGMTNISFSFFFWTNILARGLGIACTVFFGTGTIIPFYGWGLIVWAVIFVIIAVLFYLSVRYKNKIDDVLAYFTKRNKSINNDSENINNTTNKNLINEANSTETKIDDLTLIDNTDNLANEKMNNSLNNSSENTANLPATSTINELSTNDDEKSLNNLSKQQDVDNSSKNLIQPTNNDKNDD